MNPLSWLFRAVGRAFGRGTGTPKPVEIPQTRLMTPAERQAQIENIAPAALRMAGWRDANSSWIERLNFNPLVPFAQMQVRRTGKIYTFGGMILETYMAWVAAASRGVFFNRYLKGRYTRWAGFPNVTPPDVFAFAGGAGSTPVTRR